MSLDTRRAFAFMRLNYKYGLGDMASSMLGDALEGAMGELGLDFEDVLMRLDGASEETIARINSAVEKWSGLALRLAVNETVTRLQAKLLSLPAVRRRLVALMQARLVKALSSEPGCARSAPYASRYEAGGCAHE